MSKYVRTLNVDKTDSRLTKKLYVDDLCGKI